MEPPPHDFGRGPPAPPDRPVPPSTGGISSGLGLGRGRGRGRGRGGDVNKPAWMTANDAGVGAGSGMSAGAGTGSSLADDNAAQLAAQMVRSVVETGGAAVAAAPPPAGRGRGRGRGADQRPAWMSRGDAGPTSATVTSASTASSSVSTTTATISAAAREAKFQRDLATLSSQIRSEERHRLEDEERRMRESERIRQEEAQLQRVEEEQKRVEEERNRREEEERKRREEEARLEAEELRQLQALVDDGIGEDRGGEDGDSVLTFEDEEEREARLARERREKRRKRLKEVAATSATDTTASAAHESMQPAKKARVNDMTGDTTTKNEGASMSDEKKLEEEPSDEIMAEGVSVDKDDGTDSFDMFATSPSPSNATGTTNGKKADQPVKPFTTDGIGEAVGGTKGLTRASADAADAGNFDDAEGYYRAAIGEIVSLSASVPTELGGHEDGASVVPLRVLGIIGKGVFSTVLKAVPADQNDANQSNNVLAMKLIRNNDTMAKAAVKEVRILRLLCGSKSSKKADSTESEAEELARNHNIVRLLEITNNGIDFEGKVGRRMQQQQSSMSLPPLEYRNHTTLLFEHMPYNLRETLAKFGKNVGINLTAVRSYSKQLFRALAHLAKHAVCHADIKPDNILVSADFSTVKLCDFGSAFFETDSDNVPTPYLVSRFYRAPEIILGLDYNRAVDLWSIAVTLAELFTGSVLFPGRTNNDMLKRFVDTMGPFSNKILRRHCASYSKMGLQAHFEAVPGGTYSFRRQELDKVTGRPVVKIIPKMEVNPNKQLSRLLLKSRSGSDDRTDVLRFADLLSKCLSLDPARRLGVREAWDHEFLSGKKKH